MAACLFWTLQRTSYFYSSVCLSVLNPSRFTSHYVIKAWIHRHVATHCLNLFYRFLSLFLQSELLCHLTCCSALHQVSILINRLSLLKWRWLSEEPKQNQGTDSVIFWDVMKKIKQQQNLFSNFSSSGEISFIQQAFHLKKRPFCLIYLVLKEVKKKKKENTGFQSQAHWEGCVYFAFTYIEPYVHRSQKCAYLQKHQYTQKNYSTRKKILQ